MIMTGGIEATTGMTVTVAMTGGRKKKIQKRRSLFHRPRTKGQYHQDCRALHEDVRLATQMTTTAMVRLVRAEAMAIQTRIQLLMRHRLPSSSKTLRRLVETERKGPT